MRSARISAIVALAIPLALLVPRAAVAAGSDAPSGSCNVTSGGIGSGGNTVTCNFGMPPEQLKATIEAAVDGRLIDRIVDISKTLGVTEDAAKTLLKIVGEDPNIPDDKLAGALSKVAADYQRLQAQVAALNPDNPTAKALIEQAKPEIDVGHFQRAHELLRQATRAQIAAAQASEKLEQQAHEARDAQMLGAASSTAAEGDVAMTERRFKEAAGLFAQAADYVPGGHATEHGGYLRREALALYQQGDERGDSSALEKAAGVCQRALEQSPRPQGASDWAATQVLLGNALNTLGYRESGTERLNEAVSAYHAALEEQTRERVPLAWAITQMDLGTALFRLGERESGTARLEEAVAAYRAALEEQTRERVPLAWANTQMGLGTALFRLGERESGTARLEEAVAAYRAALEEQTRERVPLDWAATTGNQGVASMLIADRTKNGPLAETALRQIQTALETLRDGGQQQWAAVFQAQAAKAQAIRDRLKGN